MRSTTLPGLAIAIALGFTAGSVTVYGQSPAPDGVKTTVTTPAPAKTEPPSGTFATLNGVKAVPMAPRELDAVKGMHIHFATPGQNSGHPHVEPFTGWHFVNHTENNLGNGNAKPGSGPGYSGLCGAALNSPALVIPGQNTTTGIGGGC